MRRLTSCSWEGRQSSPSLRSGSLAKFVSSSVGVEVRGFESVAAAVVAVAAAVAADVVAVGQVVAGDGGGCCDSGDASISWEFSSRTL